MTIYRKGLWNSDHHVGNGPFERSRRWFWKQGSFVTATLDYSFKYRLFVLNLVRQNFLGHLTVLQFCFDSKREARNESPRILSFYLKKRESADFYEKILTILKLLISDAPPITATIPGYADNVREREARQDSLEKLSLLNVDLTDDKELDDCFIPYCFSDDIVMSCFKREPMVDLGWMRFTLPARDGSPQVELTRVVVVRIFRGTSEDRMMYGIFWSRSDIACYLPRLLLQTCPDLPVETLNIMLRKILSYAFNRAELADAPTILTDEQAIQIGKTLDEYLSWPLRMDAIRPRSWYPPQGIYDFYLPNGQIKKK